jgi:CheY-like chemotaxis protein
MEAPSCNVVTQKVACLALTKLGCRVDAAANGKEGVEMIRTIPYDV